MTELQLRNKVVSVAKTFLGYNEANGQDDIIIKKYNLIKPEGGYTMRMNDPWCAAFASVVGNIAGLSNIIPIECSCESMIKLFKQMGCWDDDGTIIPKIGDYIFYNWDDCTQPNDGWADHVGVVTAIQGKTITVIEGNKNNAVEYRTISVGWGYIRGYGKPDYASVASEQQSNDVQSDYNIGDYVEFTGNTHYTSSYESGVEHSCTPGKAQITAMNLGKPHPYHVVGLDGSTVYGWVDESSINGKTSVEVSQIKVGDKVKVNKAVTYSGSSFKCWFDKYDVIDVAGNRVVIGIGKSVTCAIHIDNISKV